MDVEHLIVFDMDGTLASDDTKNTVPKDKYYTPENLLSLKPIPQVVNILHGASFLKGTKCIVLTARAEDMREATEQWLRNNIPNVQIELYMRPGTSENPPRQYIKRTILRKVIEETNWSTRFPAYPRRITFYDDQQDILDELVHEVMYMNGSYFSKNPLAIESCLVYRTHAIIKQQCLSMPTQMHKETSVGQRT